MRGWRALVLLCLVPLLVGADHQWSGDSGGCKSWGGDETFLLIDARGHSVAMATSADTSGSGTQWNALVYACVEPVSSNSEAPQRCVTLNMPNTSLPIIGGGYEQTKGMTVEIAGWIAISRLTAPGVGQTPELTVCRVVR